jgi:hypothetical protein
MAGKAGEHDFHVNVLHWATFFRSSDIVIECGSPAQSGALDFAIAFPTDETVWVIEFGVADKGGSSDKVADFVIEKLEQAQRYAIGEQRRATTYSLAVVFQKTTKASAAETEEFKYATSLALSRRGEDVDQRPSFETVKIE